MKFIERSVYFCLATSPPSRGAWIEILASPLRPVPSLTSPPSRGAWIEMRIFMSSAGLPGVAPLAGGVD